MMQAARKAIEPHGANRPLLIGVTVLTSMLDADLLQVGVHSDLNTQVNRLAILAQQAGLDGVVCSAHEVSMIKSACGNDFKTITPGIRLEGDEAGDQQRVMTPKKAISLGSDFLVVGRPITTAAKPMAVVRMILDDIAR